jgi:hypothetical protein
MNNNQQENMNIIGKEVMIFKEDTVLRIDRSI